MERDSDIEVSRATLCQAVMAAGGLLQQTCVDHVPMESQSVRARINQNPRGIVFLFFPSLLKFEPSTFWRSFKKPVKVDAKNGLNPFLFLPIQYISTFTGRFELRGNWSGNAILAQIANVCDLIQS